MQDLMEQVIQTLSSQMRIASEQAVMNASYAAFKTATVVKLVSDHVYRVSLDDRLVDFPVYGDCHFERGEKVYIISPHNSKNFHDMFILGKSIDISSGGADHKTLMEVVEQVNRKLDKSAIVQETGQGTTNVMSQKAVTDALDDIKKNAGVRSVICGHDVLPVTADGAVTIPIATTTHTGVVMAAAGENQVMVDGTGVMSVNALDIMRVNQHEGDLVVLDAGGTK